MSTKVITAHVPLELAEKVDEMATSLERSRGWIVKEALSVWVAQAEERRQWTLDALADVDASRVVDHSDVRAWAERLGSETPLPLPVPKPAATPKARNKRSAPRRTR